MLVVECLPGDIVVANLRRRERNWGGEGGGATEPSSTCPSPRPPRSDNDSIPILNELLPQIKPTSKIQRQVNPTSAKAPPVPQPPSPSSHPNTAPNQPPGGLVDDYNAKKQNSGTPLPTGWSAISSVSPPHRHAKTAPLEMENPHARVLGVVGWAAKSW